MKRKFLIALGAIVLTGAGAFAGRLTAKNNPIQLFATSSSGCVAVTGTYIAPNTNLTTGGSSGNQATIQTVGGASHKLFATQNCQNSAVRYHG